MAPLFDDINDIYKAVFTELTATNCPSLYGFMKNMTTSLISLNHNKVRLYLDMKCTQTSHHQIVQRMCGIKYYSIIIMTVIMYYVITVELSQFEQINKSVCDVSFKARMILTDILMPCEARKVQFF